MSNMTSKLFAVGPKAAATPSISSSESKAIRNDKDPDGRWFVLEKPNTECKLPQLQAVPDSADVSMSLAPRVASHLRGGLKPTRMTLPFNVALNNTAANLSQFVTNVAVTSSPEWTSLQALYDEYRLLGGRVRVSTLARSSGASPGANNGWFCMGYDPLNPSVPSSVSDIAQLAQRVIAAVPVNTAAGTGPFSVVDGKGHSFAFKTDAKRGGASGLAFSSTGLVTYAPGMWRDLPTGGSTATTDGLFKVYWINDTASTSATVATAFVELDVELRSRR